MLYLRGINVANVKIDFTPIKNNSQPVKIDFTPIGRNEGVNKRPNPTLLDKLANNPLTNAIVNAGGGISHGILSGVAALENIPHTFDKNIPAVTAPKSPYANPQSAFYGAGNVAGQTIPFAGAGEALNAVRGVSEGLPVIGRAARFLGGDGIVSGAARRTTGAAIYGGATSPNNKLSNALKGATVGAVMEAAPAVINTGVKYADKIVPSRVGQKILNRLGNGLTLAENQKDLENSIRNAFNRKKQQVGKLYHDAGITGTDSRWIFNRTGHHLPGLKVKPSLGNSEFGQLPDDVLSDITSKKSQKKLYDAYTADPTLQNAHQLKSALLHTARQLNGKGQGTSIVNQNAADSHIKAASALATDIDNYLEKSAQKGGKYAIANRAYATQIAPYYDNKTLKDIVSNNFTGKAPIANLFKYENGPITTALQDLPDTAKNKILYHFLGGKRLADAPEKLFKKFSDLKDVQGIEHLLTPQVKTMHEELGSALAIPKIAAGVGALGTAGLTHHLLGTEVAESALPGLGVLAGFAARHHLKPYADKLISLPAVQGSAHLVKDMYPSATKAILANILQGEQ